MPVPTTTFPAPLLFLLLLLFTITTATPLSPRQATNGPHNPSIIWSCTVNPSSSLAIPSICKNMCYGAYCRGYGTLLTWDDFAGAGFASRKRNAGCFGPAWGAPLPAGWDRCTGGKMACSAYPVLSTAESDVDAQGSWGPVSRCVDAGEDARQNIILYHFYTSTGIWTNNQGLNNTPPSQFHQIFANAGDIEYCSPSTTTCIPDGAEQDRLGVIYKYDPPSRVARPRQRTWRLKGGGNFTASHDFRIGDKVVMPRVRDDELFVKQSGGHVVDARMGWEQSGYMGGNLWFEDDEIEGEVGGGSGG